MFLILITFCGLFLTNTYSQDQTYGVDNYTKESLPQCPETFIDAETFCYILSQNSVFPPKCPFKNTLSFSSYENILGQGIGPVWLPVRRNLTSGFGFLQWTELSDLHNTNFPENYKYTGEIKGKDCLLYYNSSYIVAISCDEEHQMVCAYQKLNDLSSPLCPGSCHQSALNSDSKCICLVMSESQPKAEFLEPYQNYVYDLLTTEVCSIGLERTSNGSYIWSDSQKPLTYTYWSNQIVFNDGNIYGAATASGWILSQQQFQCSLIEQERVNVNPHLKLTLRTSDYKIILTIFHHVALVTTGPELLVNCFTDAFPLSLLYRYPNVTTATTTDNFIVYEIDPYKYGHGHYWCEVFKYEDLEVIVSNVLTITENDYFGAAFVAIFQVAYPDNINPLSQDLLKFIVDNLFVILKNEAHLSQYYTFRIMKILDVLEENKTVYFNIHLTSKPNILIDDEEEYDFVMKSITEAINNNENVQIALFGFSSLDYCLATNESNLTWPKTKSGDTIASSEYCFKSDGTRLQRDCIYNLTDGSRWSSIIDACENPLSSSVTPKLISIRDNLSCNTWYNLSEIALDYTEFLPIDIYIIGETFSTLLLRERSDLKLVMDVVDHILQINRTLLKESQLKMRATNLLLQQMDNIISNESLYNGEYVYEMMNFVFVKTGSVSGVSLKSKEATKLDIDQTIEDILYIEDLESAVWFDPSLQDQIDKDQVTVKFYYNDGFFTESGNFSRNLSIIFGVTLPDKISGFVWVIHRLENASHTEVKCMYWKYGLSERGSWVEDGMFQFVPPFLICKFMHSGNFAFMYEPSTRDVTEILNDVLESDAADSETVSRLLQISERYEEFGSVDVFLVGKILKKISGGNGIDLKYLNILVNNLHKIDRDDLFESQMSEGSTDTILHSIDTILLKQSQTTEMYIGESFGFVICNLNETDFTGLVLLKENETMQVKILEGEVNITDLVQYQDLDSALVLSSGLKNQMENHSKIIITFFITDVLFNQNFTKAVPAGKIFGVILPQMENFTGPISILHNATEITKNENHCAYWSYNEPQGLTGEWQNDSSGEVVSSLIECHFWHTTHFALLILDEDIDEKDGILEMVTIVNSALSLFGLFGIVLTAVLFKKWRRNRGNQILLNCVFAIIIQLIVFYVSAASDKNFKSFCIVTGSLLHYTTLCQFCWVLICGILQYKRFVAVFEDYPDNLLLKCCLFAWGLPLFPVTLLLIIDSDNYTHANTGLCYPSNYGLYLSVWIPLVSILLINSVIFVCVMNSVINRETEFVSGNHSDVAYQYRLAIFLFFLLGINWVFGFLAQMNFEVVFVYMFCIFATLQGFVMFLFFVVFNKNTRQLYIQAVKLYYYSKSF